MKLIIQIPCFNEEENIGRVLDELPREIDGIESVRYLVIDDGSSDSTVDTALAHGAHNVLQLPIHCGLAKAFSEGVKRALELGADIIVNTDGDNQYKGELVPDLVKPVVGGKADIVIGARPIDDIDHFSFIKKKLQKIGSGVVSVVAGMKIEDATSGFRAFSKEAALKLRIEGKFSYTIDSVIQAAAKNLRIVSVPIEINPPTRPSRLFGSTLSYILRSTGSIFRVFATYKPVVFFSIIGLLIFFPGFILGMRFLYYFCAGGGSGHIQSLILAAVLIIIGFQTFLIGIHAHLIAVNRKALEELLYYLRKKDIEKIDPFHED